MTHPEFKLSERRRFPRIRLDGTAIVLSADDCYGRYELKNLSQGGMRLKGARPMEIGEKIIAVLEVDKDANLVRVDGRVIRCHADYENNYNIYIFFEDNKAESMNSIEEIVETGLERARQNPTVLVLDSSRQIQGELKKEIISLGHNAISTGTRQEALWLLQDAAIFIDVLFLNPFQEGEPGYQFLQFLNAQYPNLQVVIFMDDHSSTHEETERFGRYAHAVLRKPWTREAIDKIVGL